MTNELGPIAVAYDDLQGLPTLRKAQSSFADKLTHPQSIDHTFAQCVEILLLNITDLLGRAEASLIDRCWTDAIMKLEWAIDFSRTMSALAAQSVQNASLHPFVQRFTLDDSSLLPNFFLAVERLEIRISAAIPAFDEAFTDVRVPERIQLLDLYLVLGHEWLMAADTVRQRPGPFLTPPISLPGEADIHHAASEPHLAGETFFMQFRACHQVTELLVWTANKFFLDAVEHAMMTEKLEASAAMISGNALLTLAQSASFPLVHNLNYRQYHKIRENLGTTSGSHSQEIHVVLLTALQGEITKLLAEEHDDTAEDQLYRQVCFQFLSLTQAWRNMHAILPKRNLGMSGTRSLIGAPEAVVLVEQMRQRWLPPERPESLFTTFICNSERLQGTILKELGKLTNTTFPDVQDRTGFFDPSSQKRKDRSQPE